MRQPPRRLSLVALLYGISGGLGLVYEVAFNKYLALVFGATAYASSAVLVAFMGGLALGAWLASRFEKRIVRPLLAYGFTELAIGAFCMFVPLTFQALSNVYVSAVAKSLGSLATLERAACRPGGSGGARPGGRHGRDAATARALRAGRERNAREAVARAILWAEHVRRRGGVAPFGVRGDPVAGADVDDEVVGGGEPGDWGERGGAGLAGRVRGRGRERERERGGEVEAEARGAEARGAEAAAGNMPFRDAVIS